MKCLFILITCCFCVSFLYSQPKEKEEFKKRKIITKKTSLPPIVAVSTTLKRNKILKDGAVTAFSKTALPVKKRETPSGIPAVDFFYYVFDVFFSMTFKPGKLNQ